MLRVRLYHMLQGVPSVGKGVSISLAHETGRAQSLQSPAPYFQRMEILSENVHPCDKPDKAGCEQTCLKNGDAAKCSCSEGFNLGEDGKHRGSILTKS